MRNPRPSLWKGPEVTGITQSLLSRFLSCRERFRLLVMEGLAPADGFNHRLEFGNMWHACEEAHAAGTPSKRWESALEEYVNALFKRYPIQQEQIRHWASVVSIQFPLYVEYWKKQPVTHARRPVLPETVFSVVYRLPSGRRVRLLGKWDSIEFSYADGVWLFETKTKGDINDRTIARQLRFDLQTMFYVVALQQAMLESDRPEIKNLGKQPVRGVTYNVIRRPLSGGKHSIIRHKPSKSNPRGESEPEYYARLGGLIRQDAGHFFMRWDVGLSQGDIDSFKHQTLNPILEQLCDWWSYMLDCDSPFPTEYSHYGYGIHWRAPYHYNPLADGGSGELDHYLETGSTAGLEKISNLFPELGSSPR